MLVLSLSKWFYIDRLAFFIVYIFMYLSPSVASQNHLADWFALWILLLSSSLLVRFLVKTLKDLSSAFDIAGSWWKAKDLAFGGCYQPVVADAVSLRFTRDMVSFVFASRSEEKSSFRVGILMMLHQQIHGYSRHFSFHSLVKKIKMSWRSYKESKTQGKISFLVSVYWQFLDHAHVLEYLKFMVFLSCFYYWQTSHMWTFQRIPHML